MLPIIPPPYSPPAVSLFVDNEKGTHFPKTPAPDEGLRRAVCVCCRSRSLVYELDFTGEKTSCMDQLTAIMALEPQESVTGSTYEKYFTPINIRPRAFALTYVAATLWLSAYFLVPSQGPSLIAETTPQPTWYPDICKLQIVSQTIPRCGKPNPPTSNANIYNGQSYRQSQMSNEHHNSAPTVNTDDSPMASSRINDGPQAAVKINTPAMHPLLIEHLPLYIFTQWVMSILGLFLWNRRESIFVVCIHFLLVIPMWVIVMRLLGF